MCVLVTCVYSLSDNIGPNEELCAFGRRLVREIFPPYEQRVSVCLVLLVVNNPPWMATEDDIARGEGWGRSSVTVLFDKLHPHGLLLFTEGENRLCH